MAAAPPRPGPTPRGESFKLGQAAATTHQAHSCASSARAPHLQRIPRILLGVFDQEVGVKPCSDIHLENRARVRTRQPRCRRDNRILKSPSQISHALRAYCPPSRGGHTLLSLWALPFHRARYSNSRRGRSQWSSVRRTCQTLSEEFCLCVPDDRARSQHSTFVR